MSKHSSVKQILTFDGIEIRLVRRCRSRCVCVLMGRSACVFVFVGRSADVVVFLCRSAVGFVFGLHALWAVDVGLEVVAFWDYRVLDGGRADLTQRLKLSLLPNCEKRVSDAFAKTCLTR